MVGVTVGCCGRLFWWIIVVGIVVGCCVSVVVGCCGSCCGRVRGSEGNGRI